ncbi:M56 family metallopeptidase [Terriglobus roseus]|uniref:TonB family C-terminal domain-containing protein n=1 Tax=Terriglobus roseus TaxID=392734 RepID=A0A1H4KN76_9BACT|nr:M56 family metallopeptidase [Terriglobus roseus]SEB60039.1 TonB family C-terminal domain-containing protein [Terriglobus roseus]
MTGPDMGGMHLLYAFWTGVGFAMEQDVAAFALHALWQVPLLACAAAMAVRIGRPHVRVAHVLWVVTLAMCVLVPFASTVLAQRAAVAASRDATAIVVTDGVSVEFGDLPPMQRQPVWKLAFERHILSRTPFAFTLSPRIARSITMVYAVVLLVFASRLIMGWRRTRSLVRAENTQPLPSSIAQALHRQCDAIGCEAPLAALTADLPGPALAGVLRPTLLMPVASAAEMSSSEIEAVLAHELAHLRRGDPVLHAACSLLLLPVGFHPAALWTARRVRQTREMACDAEAAERLGSASGYAHALLQVAERSGGLSGVPAGLGLFGLGFFGLGLFDSEVRPRGGYRAALRGGRLQHGRRPATAGLPLFGVAGAMEERMQTMMKLNPPETGAKRALRGVAAVGLGAIVVMAAAMVQVQPALARSQEATPLASTVTADAPRLLGGEHAQQQLQNARRQLADAQKSASSDVERKKLATAQAVIATAEQQLAAASGPAARQVVFNLTELKDVKLDPQLRTQLEALKDLKIDPKDAEKIRADAERMRAQFDSPEFKARMEKVRAEAERMRSQFESPEFKERMQKQRAEAERMRAQFESPEFKAQLEKQRAEAERMRAEFESPEFKAKIQAQLESGRRQVEEARRLMARNEMPPMSGEPAGAMASGQDATKPRKIDPGIMAGQVLNKVQPKYPQSAKDAHVSGAVVLHAIIDETGKVEQLAVISSPDKDLSESALDAVRQWTYRPYLLNGQPMSVETTITVNFSFAAEVVWPGRPSTLREVPVLLTRVDPVMPNEARQRLYSDGLVTLRVQIGSTGKVDAVQAMTSPDPPLSTAAIDAVKQWTFRPAVGNGVPVATDTLVKVNSAIL